MTYPLDQSGGIFVILATSLFVMAGLMDVATRTIPNALCACVLTLGLAEHIFDHTLAPALLGFAVVFVLCFVFWSSGLFGGGDAKLLSAAALFVPTSGIPNLILMTALSGGVLSLFYIVASRCFSSVQTGIPTSSLRRILYAERQRILRRESLPYAVAIASGSIFVMISH